jgi:hypothetical protein
VKRRRRAPAVVRTRRAQEGRFAHHGCRRRPPRAAACFAAHRAPYLPAFSPSTSQFYEESWFVGGALIHGATAVAKKTLREARAPVYGAGQNALGSETLWPAAVRNSLIRGTVKLMDSSIWQRSSRATQLA